jgi:FkbM family methyltransferase
MIVTDQHLFATASDHREVVMVNTGRTAFDAVREVWVEDVYRIDTLDLTGGVVVDVGAHQGAFTLRALARGADRVVAIEPDPGNVTWLRENLQANNVEDRVLIVQAAVGPAAGRGAASVMPGTDMVTIAADPAGDVEVVDLGDVIFEASTLSAAGDVRLLKVDIEGGEYGGTMSNCGLGAVQRLVMETHAAPPGTLGELIETLLDTHNLDVFGHPANGGMLYGDRY